MSSLAASPPACPPLPARAAVSSMAAMRPGLGVMATTRLPMEIASSRSWVTRTSVMSRRRVISSTSRCRARRVIASSAEKGSSRNRAVGSTASERASATRCCWPPDRLCTLTRLLSARPTISSSWSTRSAMSRLAAPANSRPRPTLSRTFIHGYREGFWNIMFHLAEGRVTWRPPILTQPSEGISNPAIICSRVDLPHPLRPISTTRSPLLIWSSMASRTVAAPGL